MTLAQTMFHLDTEYDKYDVLLLIQTCNMRFAIYACFGHIAFSFPILPSDNLSLCVHCSVSFHHVYSGAEQTTVKSLI